MDSLSKFSRIYYLGAKLTNWELLQFSNYEISRVDAHTVLDNVKMLFCILANNPVIEADLIKYTQTSADYVQIFRAEKDLSALDSVISKEMKKRMVNADLPMALLQKTFEIEKYKRVAQLLKKQLSISLLRMIYYLCMDSFRSGINIYYEIKI